MDRLDVATVLAEQWAGGVPDAEELEGDPEWFAMAAPYGQQFPGLAPAQAKALTEAEVARALGWFGPARPGSGWCPLPGQPMCWHWWDITARSTGTARPMCDEFWPVDRPGTAVREVGAIAERINDIPIWSLWLD